MMPQPQPTEEIASSATPALPAAPRTLLDEIVEETFQHWTQPYEVALKHAYERLVTLLPDQSERFIKAVWLHFQRNPSLQVCTDDSIQAAAVNLALSGLDITQPGEAWLIPMEVNKKYLEEHPTRPDKTVEKWRKVYECVVWDGYLGRLKLARQSPDVIDIDWDIVRANDTYRYRGKTAIPEHLHPENFQPRGNILGVYAYIVFTSGRIKCLQMSMDDVRAHRNQYSRAAKSGAWQEQVNGKENRGLQHMVAKTVLNQLCHPRNMSMTRAAAQIIGLQEQYLETQKPANGHTMQPQEPIATPTPVQHAINIADTFGDQDDAMTAAVRQPVDMEKERCAQLKTELRHRVSDANIQLPAYRKWFVTQNFPAKENDWTRDHLVAMYDHLVAWGHDALQHDIGTEPDEPDAGSDPAEEDWKDGYGAADGGKSADTVPREKQDQERLPLEPSEAQQRAGGPF